MAGRLPSGWEDYERGASPGRSGSLSSTGNHSVRFEDDALLEDGNDEDMEGGDQSDRRHRRGSAATNRLAAIAGIGGVNSIRSFSRSWQRAAAFPEVIPQPQAFVFAPDQEPIEPHSYGRRSDLEASRPAFGSSLIRQRLEAAPSDNAIADSDAEAPSPTPDHHLHPSDSETKARHSGSGLEEPLLRISSRGSARSMRSGRGSIFSTPPLLSGPPMVVGSYESYNSYGTVDDSPSHPSMEGAANSWHERHDSRANQPDGERPPILVKEVEQEGRIVLQVSGQSTLPQTIVNSTNVLIGVGLLSLPMGIKYSGWLFGMVTLFLCAVVTSWTAKILARCLDRDRTSITFSDIAYQSFGPKARVMTAVLFTLELLAACVALIVLFADSLSLLFPGSLTVTQWKIVCTLILVPLQFAPLAILSFTSFIGILCCMTIIVIIVICGLLKPTFPGSLIEPATTYLFPSNWLTLPLSFGLLMSPWGGHSVFPNIYRDMRHPHKYGKAVNYTFSFTYVVEALTAVVGLLMFGDGVRDEITANILRTTGYPQVLHILLVVVIAVIPITKIPLNAQPIVTTIEVLVGLRQQGGPSAEPTWVGRLPATTQSILRSGVRIVTLGVFLVIAILFPAFDVIMAFMGSALCFTICVTLPLAFYLKLFSKEISKRETILVWFVMLVSLVLSIVGTVWAFLPKSYIGAT